ncbi:MAG: hypothetical protein U0271_07215 [Polyangiaceae bacterium]
MSRWLVVPSTLASVLVLALGSGCISTNPLDQPGNGGGDSDTTPSEEDGICLLNNCTEDLHCSACSGGHNTCDVATKRCVACEPGTGAGCDPGMLCTEFGDCVAPGLACETDEHGTPTVSCTSSGDCAACDPLHQVCDDATGTCVACSDTDTAACQSTDQCIAGTCIATCPATCTVDADCGSCGGPGNEAHACNAHICAECSPTSPCSNGEVCSAQGVCERVCGSDGKGACTSDAQCASCGAGNDTCHKPAGSSSGTCGPDAAGCSDLDGIVQTALPAPWNQVTNTCSNDADCAGVGVSLNVGEMLRDLTGIDSIGDANIDYGMNACAAISVAGASCGVCVPCNDDADCAPIDIDAVAGDAFGPIGSVAAAFLLDQIFGPSEHQINLYCSPIAGGYGVCAPCPGLIYECGVSDPGGGGGSGTCSHDTCTAGSALDGSCDSCAADVCSFDSYCCSTAWDETCISEAESTCGASCGGGTTVPDCHDECVEGAALDPTCSPCVEAICNSDDYCCTTTWDALCIDHVGEFCTPPCQ